MILVCWQVWRDIREVNDVAMNKGCHDVGMRKQQLECHNSWGCWYFTLLYGFVYCTVLMLAVLTDGRWKLAATYCNNIACHHCGMVLTVGGNLLPHTVTTLDVTTVAWCCRQTQDVLHPAECPPAALQTSQWQWTARELTGISSSLFTDEFCLQHNLLFWFGCWSYVTDRFLNWYCPSLYTK